MFAPLCGAAGLAEMTGEDGRRLEQTFLFVLSIPFLVYCVGVILLLIVVFWKPSRRQKLNLRLVVALATFLGAVGLLLLVPTMPFWSSALSR